MSAHTPGPWTTPYYDDNPGDRGWWIHNGKVGSEEFAVASTFSLNPNAEADARLIAAAPELLEALQSILAIDVHSVLTTEQSDAIWVQAKAAVAKALGQEPRK